MTDKIAKQIAKQLKEVRLQKGLTQTELAKKAGLNSNYYAKIERAELTPSVTTFEKLVKALGVKSADIFPF